LAGGKAERQAADPRWTLAATILASSLSFVDGSVLNVALPAIRSSYQAGAADVQWVVNAYLLPLSALLLLGGALGDHYGRRRLLVLGTFLFAVASLVCALAPSLELLLAARGGQGIGAALLLRRAVQASRAPELLGRDRGNCGLAIGVRAAVGRARLHPGKCPCPRGSHQG
jgi:MFS family permease